MQRMFELKPDTGNRKSFYGKAMVVFDTDGSELLFSYGTLVMKKNPDGTYIRIWDDWSVTTGRHIKAFCGMNKAEFMGLPVRV